MYAVIETGGKQYRVEVGTELQVELLDIEPGKTITLDRVLLVTDGDQSSIGRPIVPDAAVSAQVVRQIRGEKLISFKYRPKARSRVKKGHRQELTVLRISDIVLNGKSAAASAEKAEQDAKTERQRLEEAALAQGARDAELAAKLAVGVDAAAEPPTRAKATATARARAEEPAKAVTVAKAEKLAKAVTAAKATGASPTKVAPKATPGTVDVGSAKPATRSRAKATSGDAPADSSATKRTRTTQKDE